MAFKITLTSILVGLLLCSPAFPDWFLEISESDTAYENYTALRRRVNALFGYPKKHTRTQTLSVRRVNAVTPSSLLQFEEGMRPFIDAALTAGELSALTQSDPGGYSLSAMSNTSDGGQLSRYIPYNTTRAVLTDGDSIISFASSPWTLDLADRVYSQVADGLGNLATDAVINVGVGGKSLADLVTDAEAKIHDLNFPAECEKVLVIMAGTNDITHDAASADDAYASLVTYVTAAQSAIENLNVIVVTPIARINDVEPTATLRQYRLLILGGAEANGYTVADAGGLSMFDESSDTANATYYQADEEHPTATGAGEIADVIVSAIEGL